MQSDPLNLVQVLEHAARFHGSVEVVSRRIEDGTIFRYCYADAWRRTLQLAGAIRNLGVEFGDRVGTMAWNGYRHFEAWYAIAGQGAICHTINPRLFESQIEYIINHAEDKILLVDAPFLPLVERLRDRLTSVECIVVLTDREHLPETSMTNVVDVESLMADEPESFDWPSFPESTISSLCYTSGTTGDPKGVPYTHRSNFFHALATIGKDCLGLARDDTMLMVVPMFHANSWGLAYTCPMVGAKLVLPGNQLSGASLYELLENEQVTLTAGVPTLWKMLLGHLEEHQLSLPYLQEVIVGGAAVPRSLLEAFDQTYGVNVIHAWGMTETSPMGTLCRLKPFMKLLPHDQKLDILSKQGIPVFGVCMKIVDDDGRELDRDGKTFGRLLVKGPWVVQRYYRAEEDAVDAEGWFDTGDIATIDQYGYMQITDRAKDLIKSGGEWISSVDLENAAAEHPEVETAAAIAMEHPKWGERPLLIIKLAKNATLTVEQLLDFLESRVAKWWLPDAIEFVDEIPLTATGKISKLQLRERFRNDRSP